MFRIRTLNHNLDVAWDAHQMDPRDDGFYDHLRRVIQHIIWLKLGRSDEDLVQDIMLKISQSLEQFDGKSQFSTWVFSVVSNHIINSFKATQPKEYPLEAAESLPVTPMTVKDWQLEVNKLIKLIPDDTDRQIASLKLSGYSNAEIGKKLNFHKRQVIRRWIALCEKLREAKEARHAT
jgi:RNA polymerase sigma factor (sigma-70 family)